MIRLARSFRAAKMPSGTPITTASATDTIISDSVSIAGSHSPTTPGNAMHPAANAAERQRPVLAISANTTTGNVNHGSPRKNSVSESSVALTRCRNGSRNHVNSGWVRRFVLDPVLQVVDRIGQVDVQAVGEAVEAVE